MHKIEGANVKSMAANENVQCVDNFVDDNKVQYDDTLEEYIDNEEYVE